MRRFVFALVCLAVASIATHAQSNDTAGQKQPDTIGVITGRVLDDAGQPVFNADVRLDETGSSGGFVASGNTVATDEEGKFRAEGLGPHAYSLTVSAAGYVQDTAGPADRAYHYIGDVVTLRVKKGGVITGKVTRAEGEPVIAVRITVTMVRRADGTRAADVDETGTTDDRGIYRVYGLDEGTYIVSASGQAQFFLRQASFTSDDTPTYYPSAPLEGAGEVAVHAGQEVTGIDITYRGEHGHKASGLVVGAEGKRGWVSLRRVTPPADVGTAPTELGTGAFEFEALADGEYEASASMYGDSAYESTAPPVKFKVRGSDVAGIKLVLQPVASVTGKVILTGMPAADATAPCPARSARTVGEVVVRVRFDDPARARSAMSGGYAAVDAAGAFKASPVEAARFHVSAQLPDDGWYVQSVVRVEEGKKTPVDIARDGLSVGAGQDIAGVTVTVAAGAAGVAGRVAPVKEGDRLPDVVRVHLVPAEADAGEAAVRFYEVKAERDGTFEFKNVAPGAYRAIAVADTTSQDDVSTYRPAAWDQASRVQLRKAVAALPEITLALCAVQKDMTLRLSASAPPRAGR